MLDTELWQESVFTLLACEDTCAYDSEATAWLAMFDK